MEDLVNHPAHYNQHPTGIECIDIVEHFNFNVGNAIKYLWRAGLKESSDPVLDLRKAEWYCKREAERVAKEQEAQRLFEVDYSHQPDPAGTETEVK